MMTSNLWSLWSIYLSLLWQVLFTGAEFVTFTFQRCDVKRCLLFLLEHLCTWSFAWFWTFGQSVEKFAVLLEYHASPWFVRKQRDGSRAWVQTVWCIRLSIQAWPARCCTRKAFLINQKSWSLIIMLEGRHRPRLAPCLFELRCHICHIVFPCNLSQAIATIDSHIPRLWFSFGWGTHFEIKTLAALTLSPSILEWDLSLVKHRGNSCGPRFVLRCSIWCKFGDCGIKWMDGTLLNLDVAVHFYFSRFIF